MNPEDACRINLIPNIFFIYCSPFESLKKFIDNSFCYFSQQNNEKGRSKLDNGRKDCPKITSQKGFTEGK